MAAKYITDIRVVGMEKIKKDIAGKRYEFILEVKWNNSVEPSIIYRPHSMFFDFQGVLLEMFKNIKIPNAPVAKFHWSLLGKLGHEKECKSMEEFCQKIIRMPPVVSQASLVLHFFEMWGTDHRVNPKSSEIFDEPVGRSSILSSQEQRLASISENAEQYKIIAEYNATNIGELSLIEGQYVTIIEKNERGWWFVANKSGKQGWAPATYLEPIHANGDEEVGYDWVSVIDSDGIGERYISLVSYEAQNQDELSYSANQNIEVIEKSSYGWWKVRINRETGITPATNLRRAEDSFLYQTTNELKSRTVSISSASGLYAVIRKPPPRKESVRSRSSSGQSNLPSPNNSLKQKISNDINGTKKRFVYSQASFSSGKFVIGEEDEKENEELVTEQLVRHSIADDTLKSHDSYENVDSGSSLKETGEVEIYQARRDFIPDDSKREDILLKQGDLVQYISSESGWMFVLKLRSSGNYISSEQQQGWVPESYLKRKYDIDPKTLDQVQTEKPKPKPTPRPRPRPRPRSPNSPTFHLSPEINKNKSHLQTTDHTDENSKQIHGAKKLEDITTIDKHGKINNNRRFSTPVDNSKPGTQVLDDNRRPSAPILVDNRRTSTPSAAISEEKSGIENRMAERPAMPLPLLNEIQNIGKYDEDLYDQPEAQLRSVYDSEPWYYGSISRTECERILGTYGRQQEFLVRESLRAPGSYALSVKYCYRIRHFPIEATPNNHLLIGKLTFPNLMDIVSYYQEKPLFFSEHKEPISLGKCLMKKNIPR